MIVMLDTNDPLERCSAELGYPTEQLLTPLTRYKNRHLKARFAIDNGAFSKFNRQAFEALLEREKERQAQCRFVALPDVIGSARRTLELFEYWYEIIAERKGWPVALVAQDGQEDLPIEWHKLAAIFIGGSTKFKESEAAKQIIKAAQAMDVWAHVGRVNDPSRFEGFRQLGVDSVDGSGIARYTWMRERLGSDPALFTREEMVKV